MKKAFIAGPTYAGDLYLQETVNDVANWAGSLAVRGFSEIIAKTAPEATTREALRAALQAFTASLIDGDSAAIILLGHGGQITDISGEERDGLDECFAASDFLPISDDEIGGLIASCPRGAKVSLVMDYCHSATPDQPLMGGFRADYKASKAVRIFPTQWASFGSCNEAETSYSALSGGLWYSLFSLYLCWALRTYPAMSAIELMTWARGYVQAAVPAQNPQLAGAYLDRVPF